MKKAITPLAWLLLAGCGGGASDRNSPTPTPVAAPVTITAPAAPEAIETGSYFQQDSPRAWQYTVRSVDQSGAAAKLTFINYAFSAIEKHADGSFGCAISLPEIDYGQRYVAAQAVSGQADDSSQTLFGNFNQFRQLKAKYPRLKVLISLGGGGNGGKWFSEAAQTAASRQQLVANCIDTFIRGNLPMQNFLGGWAGGAGAAAGVFDGFDLDWEYPGIPRGDNTVDTINDKHNFTLLMQEFRTQLDAYGASKGGWHYYLTYAGSVIFDKFGQTEALAVSSSIDWVNLMDYDFHAADWQPNGPTDFHANLYGNPASPTVTYAGTQARFDADSGVQAYLTAGVPASKLVLGVSYHGYGWGNVPDGGSNGLYQPASGGANSVYGANNVTWALSYPQILALPGSIYHDPITQSVWKYDAARRNFFSFEDPVTIGNKVNYVQTKQMRGLFSWSLGLDDPAISLTTAMAKIRP